jgi:hypothetical protein
VATEKKHDREELIVEKMKSVHTVVLLFLFFAGCTTIRPEAFPDQTFEVPRTFSHEAFDRVLRRYVDDKGLVDYAALKKNPQELERYYHTISHYSPDSHPALFPTEAHRLAYWINAYNASSIKIVLTHYPILSVLDVKTPFPFFFLPDGAGFFAFQRLSFGGGTTNLYYLENGVIRKRFAEPRVHFALNCSALGCPKLPRLAFTGENLDEELDREARKFLSEERNLKLDHKEKAIYLSEIFDWYRGEFLSWYKKRFPGKKATLVNYIILYLPRERADELKRLASSYKVRFIPYDWRLNDQHGP